MRSAECGVDMLGTGVPELRSELNLTGIAAQSVHFPCAKLFIVQIPLPCWIHDRWQVEIDALFVARRGGGEALFVPEGGKALDPGRAVAPPVCASGALRSFMRSHIGTFAGVQSRNQPARDADSVELWI